MARSTSLPEFIKRFFAEIGRKKISAQEKKVAQDFFESLKKEVISQILNDPISKELINHTFPSPLLGVNGTLFGFLGFVEGSEPVNEIIEVVEKTMSFTLSRRLIKRGYRLSVKVPTLPDFRTPGLLLPWQGGLGAVEAIERGVTGLSYYIGNKSNLFYSRSAEGVQTLNKIRDKEFRSEDWISKIFRNVKETSKSFK